MSKKKIYIIVEELPFIQIIHNALESFTVEHLDKKDEEENKYLETYGLLWGNYTKIKSEDTSTNIYTVSFISIDTSTEKEQDSCMPNEDSLILKKDIMTSYWPQYRFLGDFHTHPYTQDVNGVRYNDVVKEEYYNLSPADKNRLVNRPAYWKKFGYKVGLVVTIVDMKNKVKKKEQKQDNLVVFNIGNYRLWIKSYHVWYRRGTMSKKTMLKIRDEVILRIPSITGLADEYTLFGKHIDGFHEEGELGHI